MTATVKALPRIPNPEPPLRRIHQWIKKAWLAGLGLRPAPRARIMSPNPGDQAWYLAPEFLPPHPTVFSLGLAEDLSFDRGMIRDYEATVHGFDPTETTRKFLLRTKMPADFHYHAVALAGHDGVLDLYERLGQGGKKRGKVFQSAPCRCLSSLFPEMGLEALGLLKIDIEGSEYSVLEDLWRSPVRPAQVALEFHHRFEEIGVRKTVLAHRALIREGYQLAHISPWGEEFLYIFLGDRF